MLLEIALTLAFCLFTTLKSVSKVSFNEIIKSLGNEHICPLLSIQELLSCAEASMDLTVIKHEKSEYLLAESSTPSWYLLPLGLPVK